MEQDSTYRNTTQRMRQDVNQKNKSENLHILNVRTGLITAKTKYGVTMDEYDYIDIAIDFLRDVNDYSTGDFYIVARSNEMGDIPMPCNLKTIDAVMTRELGLKRYSDRILYREGNTLDVDSAVVANSFMNAMSVYPDLTSFDVFGEGFVSYRFTKEGKLNIKGPGQDIVLAYTGVSVDEEGFPLVTRKQANGLAAAVLHNRTLFKALRGDKAAASMIPFTQAESGRLKQAASIPESISDNEFDELLNAKTSFNRKSHSRPSKFSR